MINFSDFTLNNNKQNLRIALFLSPYALLGTLGMDIYIPAMPMVAKQLISSHMLIQLTLSIYMLGTGAGQLVFGFLADTYGRKPILLLCITLFFIASVLCAISLNIYMLNIARLFQSLGGCGALVVTTCYIKDRLPWDQQALAYSYLTGFTAIVPIIGPLIGSYILLWFATWRAIFILLSSFALLCFILAIFCFKESKPKTFILKEQSFWHDSKNIFLNFNFTTYSLLASCAMSALFLFFMLSSIVVTEDLFFSLQNISFYFAANTFFLIIGSILAANIRLKQDTLIFIGFILMKVSGALMYFSAQCKWLSSINFILLSCMLNLSVGLIRGPVTAAALQNFNAIVGHAASWLEFLRFVIPSVLGIFVSKLKNHTPTTLAISLLILGNIGILFLLMKNRFLITGKREIL